MMISGHVTMSINMNVCNLETNAVCKDEYGDLRIEDPEQFFDDWVTGWIKGEGELLGACEEKVYLERYEYDEDDEEDDD